MMKKRWILLMMCACISGLGGCGKQTITEKAEETETADSMKEDTTELCAYIKEINGNTLVIDPVEYISSGTVIDWQVTNTRMTICLTDIIYTIRMKKQRM